MEFAFMSASEARKLYDLYKDAVEDDGFMEFQNSINMGINQKAQSGETSHRVYLDTEMDYHGIFVDGRTGQEHVLYYVIMDLESAGFSVEKVVGHEGKELAYLDIYW